MVWNLSRCIHIGAVCPNREERQFSLINLNTNFSDNKSTKKLHFSQSKLDDWFSLDHSTMEEIWIRPGCREQFIKWWTRKQFGLKRAFHIEFNLHKIKLYISHSMQFVWTSFRVVRLQELIYRVLTKQYYRYAWVWGIWPLAGRGRAAPPNWCRWRGHPPPRWGWPLCGHGASPPPLQNKQTLSNPRTIISSRRPAAANVAQLLQVNKNLRAEHSLNQHTARRLPAIYGLKPNCSTDAILVNRG